MKKEFLDNVRNRWFLALSAIFVILTLVVSYFGAAQLGGATGFQGLSETVLGMLSIVLFLVPILALMLGYASVVGEKERGSIHLLLAMPLTRLEALLGKFFGLATVIISSILLGLGIGGAVIMASVGTQGWENYLTFILGSMLLALVFLSVALLLSTVARRRSTAMGLAVFFWFFSAIIFDFILLGIHVATGGTISFLPGQETTYPDWFYGAGLLNPADTFSFFVAVVFGFTSAFGFSYTLPSFVNVWITTFSLVLWTLIPLGLAMWRFQAQDL